MSELERKSRVYMRDEIVGRIVNLKASVDGLGPHSNAHNGRAAALVLTKLDEAELWLSRLVFKPAGE
jgi:hypothetical protein